MKKRIVAVGSEDGALKRLAGVLWRSSFEVNRVPVAQDAAAVCSRVEPHLVVIGSPLPDLQIDELVSEIRGVLPASRHPAIVLLIDEPLPAELENFPDPRLVVLEAGLREERLQAEVLKLIAAAARVAQRLLLRLEVHLAEGKLLRMCQSENISDSGMLVRSDELFPVGTQLDFEISIPGREQPIQGQAEIMRHTVADVEKVRGLGLRFTTFKADGQRRLRDFLAVGGGLA